MASPFQVDTLGSVKGIDYSPQNRLMVLGDGNVLVAIQHAVATTSLYLITNPGSTNPTVGAALAQTFSPNATTTDCVVSMWREQAANGTDDVWVVIGSDGGAGAAVSVAHATYTYSSQTFSWDNTGTTAATAGTANSQTVSIAWNGTYLIVAYRDDGWNVSATYTSTKNGSSGWVAPFIIDSGTGSHFNPILLHSPTMAGGSSGATAIIYAIDTGSGSTHSDTLNCRILLDSAASPALANWIAHVAAPESAQNFGAAQMAATVDPNNGVIHVVTATTVVTAGIYYNKLTVNGSGAATWASRIAVDTTSGTATVSCCVDTQTRLYVFYDQGTIGTSGTVSYRTADAPFTSFSTANSTVANTAGDALPHVPKHNSIVNGYIPLLFQRGTASFTAQYDNTIKAQTPSDTQPSLTRISNKGTGPSVMRYFYRQPTPPFGIVPTVNNFTQTLTAGLSFTGPTNLKVSTIKGLVSAGLSFSGSNFQIGPGLFVSSSTQLGISNAPSGHNSPQAETDVTYVDGSGNGRRLGIIPGYGGALISARYEMSGGSVVNGISQTSLTTTNPDGFIHVLANNGTFAGSEDAAFSLTENAPTPTTPQGIWVRRYYDSGTMTVANPALNWRVRVAIQPGEPGFIFTRIDITNPSASAVTLAGADGMEIAMLGGLTTANQGAANTDAWPGTQGKYATAIGGSETAWPGDTTPGPQAADPVYVYTTPVANTGLSESLFCIKQTGLVDAGIGTTPKISYLGPPDAASSRVKVKVQVTTSSFPGSTTKTLYYIQGFRRNIAAGDINSIAADLLNPDAAGAFSTGTFSSYSYDEGAYVVATGANNRIAVTHTFTTPVTQRWLPSYKITSYTASSSPKANLAGTNLVWGTDYISVVDTVNQIAYVKLLKSLVSSGAVAGQLNNGLLTISPANVFTQALTATVSFVGALLKQTSATRTGGLSFTGPTNLKVSTIKGLTGGVLSFSGAIASGKQFVRALTATLSFTGPINLVKVNSKTLTAGLSFTGPTNLSKVITKGISATASFTGSMLRSTTKALTGAGLSFTGLTTKLTVKSSFTANLSLAGAFVKMPIKSLIATLSFTGPTNLVNAISKFVSGVLTFGGLESHPGGSGTPPPTRLSRLGVLDDQTPIPSQVGPLAVKRVSQALPLADTPRPSNSAPRAAISRETEDGPMTT